MTTPNGIYAAMAAIQSEFPTVEKLRKNPSQGYSFRGVDDALNHLNPLLSKHGVFLLPQYATCSIEEAAPTKSGTKQYRALVRGSVNFVALDGSFVQCDIIGEGIDSGDKALMKAQANALKYGIWYTFCVPTFEEKKDSEAFDDEPAAPKTKAAPKKKAATAGDWVARLDAVKTKAEFEDIYDQALAHLETLDKKSDTFKDIAQAGVRARNRVAG